MLLALVTFGVAAILIVLLPGPDTMVIVRSIVRGGRRRGAATALGILTGLVVWIGAAALGLAALLRASELGYDALRIAGAAYLVWLGVQTLRSRQSIVTDDGVVDHDHVGFLRGGFVAGLVSNLLNPKVGVFFVTFLPGFVPAGHSVALTTLLFGAIFVALTLVYQLALLAIAARVTGWMARPRIRRRLEIVTGWVLVGFGIRLVTES